MRGVGRFDLVLALCFVLAAAMEAAVRHHAHPAMLAFDLAGTLGLLALAVRRRRPALALCVLTAFGVLGTVVDAVLWPQAQDGGVWILALMLAAYSLGAHASGASVVLGVALPLLVVTAADLTTRTGWDRINGILFITVFVGLVPTAVGRLVRIRNRGLVTLRRQRAEIEAAQSHRQESAVLAERLRTAERLQPTLVDGLRRLADQAEAGAAPGRIEADARALLIRTRDEVVGLTAPVAAPPLGPRPPADHLPAVRSHGQRWVVLAAGAITAGLVAETVGALPLVAPAWVVVPAALAVGIPLALLWWRPVAAVAVAFAVTTSYARLVAPVGGSLSETGLAMFATFAVAALSRWRAAIVGLSACLLGQLVGVGTDDPLGDGMVLLVCWLGGRAVNHASLLVEETRANNETLRQEEPILAQRALVAERLRMARDIHDAIGHSLTVITLQAGAARRLAATDAERARVVVGTVAEVARDGLATLTRGSSLGDVSTVVARVRAAGLVVDTEVGDEAYLDHHGRQIALRVVQEGLTNVIRHAPGAQATVTVRRVGDRVDVRVANTPATDTAAAGTGSGRGLTGIRELVDAASGTVAWGPRPGGGFEVRATLPVPALASPRP